MRKVPFWFDLVVIGLIFRRSNRRLAPSFSLGYTGSMDEKSQANLERLLRAIEKIYHTPGYLLWRSFIAGLASGLGATIGAAIVLALIGFLIRELGGLPIIGQWLTDVGRILPN